MMELRLMLILFSIMAVVSKKDKESKVKELPKWPADQSFNLTKNDYLILEKYLTKETTYNKKRIDKTIKDYIRSSCNAITRSYDQNVHTTLTVDLIKTLDNIFELKEEKNYVYDGYKGYYDKHGDVISKIVDIINPFKKSKKEPMIKFHIDEFNEEKSLKHRLTSMDRSLFIAILTVVILSSATISIYFVRRQQNMMMMTLEQKPNKTTFDNMTYFQNKQTKKSGKQRFIDQKRKVGFES